MKLAIVLILVGVAMLVLAACGGNSCPEGQKLHEEFSHHNIIWVNQTPIMVPVYDYSCVAIQE